MFDNVTVLVGWIYIGKIQEQKHASHMLQATKGFWVGF